MSRNLRQAVGTAYRKFDAAKARKFIFSYLLAPCGGRSYVRFLILTRPRTGSNLLLDFLNSNRGSFARSEVFRNLHGRDHRRVLGRIFRRYPFYIRAVGFKIFYDHPLDAACPELWDGLAADETIRVIHLDRENVLRSFVSQKIAEKTNVWLDKRGGRAGERPAREKNVRLDEAELRREFEQTRRWRQEGEARFQRHPLLHLSYEDLTGRPDEAFARVCGFLGVPFRRPRTSLKRQNPERLGELVVNYRELKDSFRGGEFAGFFED